MATEIRAHDGEPCGCPPGQCAAFVEPDAACVYRLAGEVVTRNCPRCCGPGAACWHHNGACLRCAWKAKEAGDGE